MSWSSIGSMIDFYSASSGNTWPIHTQNGYTWSLADVSSADQAVILAYLREVYEGSETARNFLDLVVGTGTRIPIGTAADGQVAFGLSGHYIGIDLSKVPATYYMDNHGNVVSDKPAVTLLHEMQHWFWAATDPGYYASGSTNESIAAYIQFMENTANYDHNGQPVNFSNTVAQEMGWTDNIQSSYATGMQNYSPIDPRLASFDLAHSYTNGAIINITRFGDEVSVSNRDDTIDQTARGASSDLIFGFGGDDVINAGGGTDYVYGGDGYDIIDGGDGNDFLFGESGDSDIFGGAGNDVIVGMTGWNFLYGDDGNDIIWSRGAHASIGGDAGDDVIIMTGSSVYTSVSGGAGADTFRVDTMGGGPTTIHIADSDASDKLIYNGYVLTGGPMTVIDYEQTTSNGNTITIFEVAALDAHGNIYYRTTSDPTNVVIELADGSTITIASFTDGDLGLSIPIITNHYDANGNLIPGPYPYSNIANDGHNLDHASLSGRAVAMSTYGPEHLPDHWYLV